MMLGYSSTASQRVRADIRTYVGLAFSQELNVLGVALPRVNTLMPCNPFIGTERFGEGG